MTYPRRIKSSPSADTRDLFHGTAAAWTDSPIEAFEVWLDGKRFAQTSRTVYRSLWTGFISWLNGRGMGLDKVDALTLKTYLSGLDVKLQQRERCHRIIERAYQEIEAGYLGSHNPATMASVRRREDWRATEGNDETDFLTSADYENAVRWIEHKPAPKVDRAIAAPRSGSRRAPAAWRHQRDRAMCGVVLGGGVKLSELVSMSVKDVQLIAEDYQAAVWIRRDNAEARLVELEAFATRCLRDWLAVHHQTVVKATDPGAQALFPMAATGTPLTGRSIHRAITGFFEGAETLDGPLTPQLLRNAYAAQLFERGMPLDAVGQVLGYRQDLSIKRLRDFWLLWKDATPDRH